MLSIFRRLEAHLEAPRPWSSAGAVVFSVVGQGETPIAAPAPSLKLVLEGEEIYQIDGRVIKVQPGQFLYIEAGDTSTAQIRSAAKGLCLLLPVMESNPAAGEALDPLLGRVTFFSTHTSGLGQLLSSYGTLIATRPERAFALAPRLLARAGTAIEEPLGESRAAVRQLLAVKATTRQELLRRLELARGYLHSTSGRTVPLAELAKACGLSQFHMARYFKMAFGQSPIAYHRHLRLARAAEMLDRGTSITEVAEAAGYSDTTSFSHSFRRRFGQPPGLWKHQAKD